MTKIGEGTYGCVYLSQKSKSKTKTHSTIVTKVQRADTAVNEIAIGQQLITIPGYKFYVSPLEHAHELSIQAVTSDTYKSCTPLQRDVRRPDTTFVQGESRFVGHRTLDTFLYTKAHTLPPHHVRALLLQTYRHVQRALQKLQQHRIVHYDLHEGNILYDETYGVPILIDFGLAFQMDTATPLTSFDAFFNTDLDFPPWCIEIVLLSHLKDQPDTDVVDVAKQFVKDNPICKAYPMIAKTILNRVEETVAPLAAPDRVQHLLNTWTYWDPYALAVIYMNLIQETPDDVQQACTTLVQELVNVIQGVPGSTLSSSSSSFVPPENAPFSAIAVPDGGIHPE